MPCSQPKTQIGSSNPEGLMARRSLMAVVDQISHVSDVQRAYEALEALVTPITIDPREDFQAVKRSDFGSLLRVLNQAARDQIGKAQSVARAHMTEG